MAEEKHSLKAWTERRREKKRQSPREEEQPRDSKLAGAKPMHFDPDDERPTSEDRRTGGPPSAPGGVPGL